MPPRTNISFTLSWLISAALLVSATNANARGRPKRTPAPASTASQNPTPTPTPPPAAVLPPGSDLKAEKTFSGIATWYDVGPNSIPQRRAGKGMFFAAHDTLPLGRFVRVTNKENGRSVIVCITDRGVPDKRVIDLCKAAALQIGLVGHGRTEVRMELLKAATPALVSDANKSLANPLAPDNDRS